MNNQNPHDALRDDLKALLDGELSPLRRFLVRNHVRRCDACRKELTEMEQMTEELKEPLAAELGANLRAKILDHAPTQMPETSAVETARPTRRRVTFAEFGMVGSACLVMGVIGI
ncbi:MAG TPA: zf-HC2 domain-containing protein, partial [Abditibacteriaceae bacterium]